MEKKIKKQKQQSVSVPVSVPVPVEPMFELTPSTDKKDFDSVVSASFGDETGETSTVIESNHEDAPEGGDRKSGSQSDLNKTSLETTVSSLQSLDGHGDTWASRVEFIMVNLTTAVGLGNVWRLPITAYENGGGAFLIMYFIVVFTVGKPLFLLEHAIGQLCTCGPIRSWSMVPALRGVGVASLILCALTVTYLTGILATCCIYIVYGFSSVLPWSRCYWKNGASDYYRTEGRDLFDKDYLTCNGTYAVYNNPNTNTTFRISNTEMFYRYTVQEQENDIENGLGSPGWKLVVGVYVVWLIVFLNSMWGLRSSGKAAYFTALLPYFILIALFIKALTLEGAREGIAEFFNPREKSFWKTFVDVHVWYEAIGHCFFSYSIGYGIIIVFGSYNSVHKNAWGDMSIIGLADCVTSVLSSMTIFGMLGVLAKLTGKDVKSVLKGQGGPALAFVSYPELVLHFEGSWTPQIFCILFFFMVLTLGIGLASSSITTVTARIYERVPVIRSSNLYRAFVAAGLCFPLSILSIIYTTSGGNQMVEIVDYYLVLSVYVVVMMEIIGVAWIYGMKNFVNDVRFIFRDAAGRRKCSILLDVFQVWGYTAPFLLISILIYLFAHYDTPKYQVHKEQVPIPAYARAIGWTLFSGILLVIPIIAIRTYCTRRPKSHFRKLIACLKPNRNWGPRNTFDKLEWSVFKRTRDESTWLWKNTFPKLFANRLLLDKESPRTRISITQSTWSPSQSQSTLRVMISRINPGWKDVSNSSKDVIESERTSGKNSEPDPPTPTQVHS